MRIGLQARKVPMTSRYLGSLAVGHNVLRSAMSMNLQYKKNSEVYDSDMLAGSQVVKNIEVDSLVARKDQRTLS